MENSTSLITKNSIPMLSADNINSNGGAKAYFSTRQGGVSSVSECYSMNLNLFKPLDRESSAENFRLFCAAIEVNPDTLVLGRELHTNNVRVVDRDYIKADFFGENVYEPFDAQITNDLNICLFAYSSDCAVFLLFDPIQRVIATIHSGWKGSLNGIIGKTISKMNIAFGCKPSDILVAVGPGIGQCCFEVDEPVKNQFIEFDNSFDKYILRKGEKFHIDLDKINFELLVRAGIKSENIAINTHCTMCEKDLFHSFRRDKGQNGVNGAFIKLV